MNKYGTDVKMNYDTNNYEGISLKPGAMSCTESEVQDLPYRGIIANRRVPITVVGRVSLYAVMSTVIREPLMQVKRTYAAAARDSSHADKDISIWNTVGRKGTYKQNVDEADGDVIAHSKTSTGRKRNRT